MQAHHFLSRAITEMAEEKAQKSKKASKRRYEELGFEESDSHHESLPETICTNLRQSLHRKVDQNNC